MASFHLMLYRLSYPGSHRHWRANLAATHQGAVPPCLLVINIKRIKLS